MEKEFVLYEQALALKELGFDEECFLYYGENNILRVFTINIKDFITNSELPPQYNTCPTFSQAFRWFRENYFLFGQITIAEYELENNGFEYEIKSKDKSVDTWRGGYKTYEEAELECLKKLIEIVKNGSSR